MLNGLLAVFLVAISLLVLVDALREFSLARSGRRDFEETKVVENPVQFGGHTLELREIVSPLGASENEELGRTQLFVDGAPHDSAQQMWIRPSASGFERYHRELQVRRFIDRNGNASMWLTRFAQGHHWWTRSVEVTVIESDGRLHTDTVATPSTGREFRLYRTAFALADQSVPPFTAWRLSTVAFPLGFLLFPLGTLVAAWRLARGVGVSLARRTNPEAE